MAATGWIIPIVAIAIGSLTSPGLAATPPQKPVTHRPPAISPERKELYDKLKQLVGNLERAVRAGDHDKPTTAQLWIAFQDKMRGGTVEHDATKEVISALQQFDGAFEGVPSTGTCENSVITQAKDLVFQCMNPTSKYCTAKDFDALRARCPSIAAKYTTYDHQ